ncbi:hypothetical protein JCM10908_003947 [Rhodotorula pacifica]|uniref:uncharacterized protein n=1 Tax=Rhodotorula pacifica TaxID=1495444 RepID=UPI003173416A
MPPKPAATTQQQQQKLYRTLHDQIDLALYPQALRTVNKLLARDPQDRLALRTRTQLVVALDRYPDALKFEATDQLTRAYCLYKLARPQEAMIALEKAREVEDGWFEGEVLEAQLSYRLGEYEHARDLFAELAQSAELDSPELADLEANLSACTAQLDFLAAVPATLAHLSASSSGGSRAVLPSVDELEARPLALVLPSASTSAQGAAAAAKTAGSSAGPSTSSAPAATTTTRSRRPRGKRFAPSTAPSNGQPAPRIPLEVASQPPPAEDRWIPKRQRPSMRDALLQAKEKQRGRKREKVIAAAGAATQGAAVVEEEPKKVPTAASGGGGAKSNSGGGKKKKGGRK